MEIVDTQSQLIHLEMLKNTQRMDFLLNVYNINYIWDIGGFSCD